MKYYNVVIIGAGPAGIFAAHHILENSKKGSVLLVEKGMEPQKRECCGECQKCAFTDRCNILCGVGGSGLFSDGKLILDLHSGGKLDAISMLTEPEKTKLSENIVKTLKTYDGVSMPGPDLSPDKQREWKQIFHQKGLEIKHYNVLHMGTENLQRITSNLVNHLMENPRFTLKTSCEISDVDECEDGKSILSTKTGEEILADEVVFSVGKTGSEWIKGLFKRVDIEYTKTSAYIGVRLEASYEDLKKLLEYSFDPKIWKFSGERKVKTHCFCRHGDIICSNYMGFPVIGGHTRYTEKNDVSFNQLSPKSNFNILVSIDTDKRKLLQMLEKFRELNANGGVVQHLSDFLYGGKEKRNSDDSCINRCEWGDIRKILDDIEGTGSIIADFIMQLKDIVPGVASGSNLVYAPVLEWFMDSVKVDHNMETAHRGWFAVGDGAGLSQGIVHAAATGVIAANEICSRIGDLNG